MLSTKPLLLLLLLLSVSRHCFTAPYSPSECCYTHSKAALRPEVLKSFYETAEDCPLKSVVFETKSGVQVCARPGASWVKKAIKNLQKRKDPRAV